ERLRAGSKGVVRYVGFVTGKKKRELYEQADTFCFPSHLESFGLVAVEAMAFGVPIVTTRSGALPEIVPPDYKGLVDVKAPEQVAEALLDAIGEDTFEALRQRFEERFT